jgi:hypothetical protein
MLRFAGIKSNLAEGVTIGKLLLGVGCGVSGVGRHKTEQDYWSENIWLGSAKVED